MQTDRFPENTRSKFKSYIDINHLKNISDQNIEVAVKTIMYENSISYRKLYFNPLAPDMVIFKKFQSDEFSFSNNLQFTNDTIFLPINTSDDVILKKFDDHIYDLRKNSNEFGYDAIISRGSHTKFSSINIIMEDSQNNTTSLLQLIFLADQTIESNFDMNALLEYIYENNIFIKNVKESKLLNEIVVLFGEQLSYMMNIKIGNETKRYENLMNVFDKELSNPIEALSKFDEKRVIIKNYFHKLIKNECQQMYTKWNHTELYSELNILKQDILGLRTSIADFSIRGNQYDKITSVWNASNHKDNIVKIDFKNPSYFLTNKEKLSNANFEIVNFNTQEQPYFGVGSPTYIHCIVRGIKNFNMKQPFNVLLDSNCPESKKIFPKNTATDFKIKLAERISFNRNWMVSLQSLFLSNKLFNISGEMFNFQCEEKMDHRNYHKIRKFYGLNSRDEFPQWNRCTNSIEMINGHPVPFMTCKKGIEITAGCYTTLEELVEVIQADWEQNNFNLTIKVEDQRVRIENKNDELFDITLEISPYLAFALGFTEELNLNSSTVFRIRDFIKSNYNAKLSVFTPKYLIICCDIVDDTIFSGEHVKLLRMVVNNTAKSEEIISFEFLHPDYVPLSVKEFSTIHVTISDVSGNPILTNSISPTYLQLVFANL